MARAVCKDNNAATVRIILPYADSVLLECMSYGNCMVHALHACACIRGVNVLTAVECAA